VKIVGIPSGMTSRELMIILQQSGAETCYMPINSRVNRRGLAFTTFPSEEHVQEFLKGSVIISSYHLTPLPKLTKTCHKKFTFQGNKYANAVKQKQPISIKQQENYREIKDPVEDNQIKSILSNIS
ncbi:8273_t:CDS:2, partial [Dentiscutata erythropus]